MQTLYRLFDNEDRLLYVGISSKWYERLHQHEKNQPWWNTVATIKLEQFDSRSEVEEAEKLAIKTEKPLHNRQHSMTFEGNQEHFDKLKFYTFHDVPVDDQHAELIRWAKHFAQNAFFLTRGKKSVDMAAILLSAFSEVPSSLECVNCQALNQWSTLERWSEISLNAFLEWDMKGLIRNER